MTVHFHICGRLPSMGRLKKSASSHSPPGADTSDLVTHPFGCPLKPPDKGATLQKRTSREPPEWFHRGLLRLSRFQSSLFCPSLSCQRKVRCPVWHLCSLKSRRPRATSRPKLLATSPKMLILIYMLLAQAKWGEGAIMCV